MHLARDRCGQGCLTRTKASLPGAMEAADCLSSKASPGKPDCSAISEGLDSTPEITYEERW